MRSGYGRVKVRRGLPLRAAAWLLFHDLRRPWRILLLDLLLDVARWRPSRRSGPLGHVRRSDDGPGADDGAVGSGWPAPLSPAPPMLLAAAAVNPVFDPEPSVDFRHDRRRRGFRD